MSDEQQARWNDEADEQAKAEAECAEAECAEAESSFAAPSGLAGLVARYLACDGSIGLYEAANLIETRKQILSIIGEDTVRKERERIIKELSS